ncbi:MAG: DNA polymerase III subunit delta' [Ruminococcus flavefaciens]|nr:DNA polymerase III subunit delta' [Ruminococcus flavefaciens]
MKKIYGNNLLISNLCSMRKSGRTAHTVLFYGEKGTGRKLMADFYTSLLMCSNPINDMPCGMCSACKNIERKTHPDVIYAETSGKLGGYSVDTARKICSDAFIKPNNNSGIKVYIFRDCHNMDVRTQNTLLKIVEEPPDYAYFIFTSETKTDFLPTIISRCVCFGVSPCTEEETELSLTESGYSPSDVKNAVSCFHGNIGLCTEYISNEDLRRQVDLTKQLADSIIKKDEYAFDTALFTLGKDRDSVRTVLSMLDKLIRDSAVLIQDTQAENIGCFREGAVKLSYMLTSRQAEKIHRCIENAWHTVECNVNITLALSAMCAEITEIII